MSTNIPITSHTASRDPNEGQGQRIIACIDGSRAAPAVCDYAAWASRQMEVPVTLLHVLSQERYPVAPDLAGNIGLGSREYLLEELAELDERRSKLALEHGHHLLDEAERLVKAGTRELLVISQDTSAYGVDLKYRTGFWQGRPVKTKLYDLCQALGEMGVWVRLHYVYPYPNVDDIIPLMAEGKLLPYLDIPLQHASPAILKAMRRPAHQDKTLQRIQRWREICPDITLRSTFIVGFPGETESDFQYLLDWLDEAQLDRVGCFEYSPVSGATANALADPVPDEIKRERWERFMARQQAISANRLEARLGREIEVIVDHVEPGLAVARSHADAPEIDGVVNIEGDFGLQPGDILPVVVEEADEYDLWATPLFDE